MHIQGMYIVYVVHMFMYLLYCHCLSLIYPSYTRNELVKEAKKWKIHQQHIVNSALISVYVYTCTCYCMHQSSTCMGTYLAHHCTCRVVNSGNLIKHLRCICTCNCNLLIGKRQILVAFNMYNITMKAGNLSKSTHIHLHRTIPQSLINKYTCNNWNTLYFLTKYIMLYTKTVGINININIDEHARLHTRSLDWTLSHSSSSESKSYSGSSSSGPRPGIWVNDSM